MVNEETTFVRIYGDEKGLYYIVNEEAENMTQLYTIMGLLEKAKHDIVCRIEDIEDMEEEDEADNPDGGMTDNAI